MTRPLRVAIVGGGIGGLTAAVALRARGFEVTVYEQASELREVGAGLQIGPNGLKALVALGLGDKLRAVVCQPESLVGLRWDDGSIRFREMLKDSAILKYGAPYWTAHRADLLSVLMAAVPPSAVHLDCQCTGCESSGDTATVQFANGHQAEADIVIGADGIHSTVRAALFGLLRPTFTGDSCWRGTVPMDMLPSSATHGTAGLDRNAVSLWIGPTGTVVCYPIRGGALLNIFAGRVTNEWTDESWSVASSRSEMLSAYAGWNDALLATFAQLEDVFKWGIFDREPLTTWTQGRIALLGDAAHPMMPTLAQGASITVEDAYVLARTLSDHADDLVAGLAAYSAERVPRASRVQLQARQQFQNNHTKGGTPQISRDWIFSHDVTAA